MISHDIISNDIILYIHMMSHHKISYLYHIWLCCCADRIRTAQPWFVPSAGAGLDQCSRCERPESEAQRLQTPCALQVEEWRSKGWEWKLKNAECMIFKYTIYDSPIWYMIVYGSSIYIIHHVYLNQIFMVHIMIQIHIYVYTYIHTKWHSDSEWYLMTTTMVMGVEVSHGGKW